MLPRFFIRPSTLSSVCASTPGGSLGRAALLPRFAAFLIGALSIALVARGAPVELPEPTALVGNAGWTTPEELEAAAAAGAPNACLELGARHLAGTGVPVDVQRGAALYERALAGGEIDAAVRLAKLFSGTALGVEADPARVFAALRGGALLGDPNFEYNLGQAIAQGRGVEADPVEGLAWVLLAGRSGLPAATVERFQDKLGLEASLVDEAGRRAAELDAQLTARKAARLAPPLVKPRAPAKWTNLDGLKLAAKQGAPNACAEYAALLIEGGVLGVDVPQALIFYMQAVKGGNEDAAYELARIYHDGLHNTATDLPLAFSYFRIAAYGGITLAQHNLGAMLVSGRGTTRDYVEGLAWLTLAAAGGAESDAVDQTRARLASNPVLIARAEQRVAALQSELNARRAKP